MTCKYVGISFLFARSNIHEYAAVARLIFDLVKDRKPEALPKVNIQYRPLRRDPLRYDEPFTEAITAAQIQEAVRTGAGAGGYFRGDEGVSAEPDQCHSGLGRQYPSPARVPRCYYSQTFRMVRANGDSAPVLCAGDSA